MTCLQQFEFPKFQYSIAPQPNFWVDAHEFYDANDEGNEAEPVAWTLIKTYKTETYRYICELNYYILIRPELEAIEIFEDIPRLDRIQVRSYILRTGLLTEKRFQILSNFEGPKMKGCLMATRL